MVNTFVTHSNYVQCAKNLNSQRLGKQRVEAYQILMILQDYFFVSRKLGIPLPPRSSEDYISLANRDYEKVASNFEARCLWMDEVARKYSTMTYIFIQERPPQGSDTIPKFFRISKDKLKMASASKIKEFKLKYRFVLYAKGYIHHPIVKMWCGYENSLKSYITSCIDEWIFRGYKNTMKRYPQGNPKDSPQGVTKSPPQSLSPPGVTNSEGVEIEETLLSRLEKPWWVNCKEIHNSHKISLLMKEKERNENPWYLEKKDFTDLTLGNFENQYIWISKLSTKEKIDLLKMNY